MFINLWEKDIPFDNKAYYNDENKNTPTISDYLIDDGKIHNAILVFPGGGYSRRSELEGEQIALWLNSLSVNAFVVNYRVAPFCHPAQIEDAKRAIRHVRYNSKKYNINPEKIGVLGFSAGGHLACMLSEQYDNGTVFRDETDRVSARPDVCILCYPVITMKEKFCHTGSKNCLLGGTDTDINKLCCEENVTTGTPPMFIWHTVEDDSVPVENSIMLAQALREKNIPFELHLFPDGKHGLKFAKEIEGTNAWPALCENWLKRMGVII